MGSWVFGQLGWSCLHNYGIGVVSQPSLQHRICHQSLKHFNILGFDYTCVYKLFAFNCNLLYKGYYSMIYTVILFLGLIALHHYLKLTPMVFKTTRKKSWGSVCVVFPPFFVMKGQEQR